MSESGSKTKCTVKGISSGETAKLTSELSSLTSEKAREFFTGKTVAFTKGSGKMANSMGRALSSRRTERSAKEYGRREGMCSGLTIEIT
jgi:hypothetical protein